MSDPLLQVRVERQEDETWRVLAPGVGWWSDLPTEGRTLDPGCPVGTLTRLRSRVTLVLPESAGGRVTDAPAGRRVVPVSWGQLLFRLRAPRSAERGEGTSGVEGERPGFGPVEAGVALRSPTDGVFYRRAAPDAPPYVELGSRLRHGQTVGLVEVMKTFHQIVYGGPHHPDGAEVIEIRAADAEEVRAGQVLIVVRD